MKFITIGVNYQQTAMSKDEANRRFAHSCNICCNRGLHIDCDRYEIAAVHDMTVAYFNDKEMSDIHRECFDISEYGSEENIPK